MDTEHIYSAQLGTYESPTENWHHHHPSIEREVSRMSEELVHRRKCWNNRRDDFKVLGTDNETGKGKNENKKSNEEMGLENSNL